MQAHYHMIQCRQPAAVTWTQHNFQHVGLALNIESVCLAACLHGAVAAAQPLGRSAAALPKHTPHAIHVAASPSSLAKSESDCDLRL